jgi:MFS family permease
VSWLLAVAGSFAARGAHGVVLPLLLLHASGAGALTLGVVQGAALLAQALALLALGGLGDRFGARRVALWGQLAAALPPLALCLAAEPAGPSALLAYAVVSSAAWGLLCPARDALVARASHRDLLHGASSFTLAQFAGLLGGIALASSAAPGSARGWLAAQALLHVAAALGTARVPRDGAAACRRSARSPLPTPAPRDAAGTPLLRELALLSALLGACAAGPYAVWAPLLADAHGEQPARAIAGLLALFPLGTIAASLALRRFGTRVDRRLLVWISHAAASLCIAGAGLAASFAATVAWLAAWGLCGGAFLTAARALLLESSAPSFHARALARCQLALLAASPAGALVAGLAASAFGVHASLLALGACGLAGTLAVVIPSRAPRTDPGRTGAAACAER